MLQIDITSDAAAVLILIIICKVFLQPFDKKALNRFNNDKDDMVVFDRTCALPQVWFMCGWQVKLCDPIVTHWPYLNAQRQRAYNKALNKLICFLYFTLLPSITRLRSSVAIYRCRLLTVRLIKLIVDATRYSFIKTVVKTQTEYKMQQFMKSQ